MSGIPTPLAEANVFTMPLPDVFVSKKRMREVSIQSLVQSEAEMDGKQEDTQQNIVVGALHPSLPMSRKQRRKQLRSESKQPNTQQLESSQSTQTRVTSVGSSLVLSATTSPEEELPETIVAVIESTYTESIIQETAEVLEPKVYKPERPDSPRRTQTDVRFAALATTPIKPVLKKTNSTPSPLPQTVSYVAALAGTKDAPKHGYNADWVNVVTESKGETDTESFVQLDRERQQEEDIRMGTPEFKRKKRIRVRRRKNRSTTESSTASKEESETGYWNATTSKDSTGKGSTTEFRDRNQLKNFSNADTLVEDDDLSSKGGVSPDSWSKRKRSIGNAVPISPRRFMKKQGEAVDTTVVSEKQKSFISTIREMLTYVEPKDQHIIPSPIPLPITSPTMPKKYVSLSKTSAHLHAHDLASRLRNWAPAAGPQPCPLKPRSWTEARTWDFAPPIHGNVKSYSNPTQAVAEFSRSSPPSRALVIQKFPPLPASPLRTLWAVSRYMEQKQNMITEHRKEGDRRWAIMKAVEKNLDLAKKKQDSAWPHNWNMRVEKDKMYMEKMVARVGFLIGRPM